MLTLPNTLTFCRAPLALLFLQGNPFWRLTAVILAMITDSIDGYLARKSRTSSQFGAFLDPMMDKFFVYAALIVFFNEGKIDLWQVAAMGTRDFCLFFYGLLRWFSGTIKDLSFQSIRWGKISTILQFIVLIGLIFNAVFPWYVYASFLAMGVFVFLELFQLPNKQIES